MKGMNGPMDDPVLKNVPSENRAQDGFTLLEVVIALIILGVCLGVLFQSLSRSKRLSWKSDETLAAVAMARNLFAERPLVKKALEAGEISGPCPESEQWTYVMTAQTMEKLSGDEPLEAPDHLNTLRLCLVHGSGLTEKSYCFEKWVSL